MHFTAHLCHTMIPRLSDSHCHLAETELCGLLPELSAEARAAGVWRFLVPAVGSRDFDRIAALHNPPQYYGAVGIHPWYADTADGSALEQTEQLLRQYPALLIGETGLDFHPKRRHNREAQLTLFDAHLQLAAQYGRPLILHNVRAAADIAAALKRHRIDSGGIAHGFSGSLEEAKLLIRHGLFIGIGSALLNPRAKKTRTAATMLDLRHLLLETDSPFAFSPDGGSCRPKHIALLLHTLARLRGMDDVAVAEILENNLNRLLDF